VELKANADISTRGLWSIPALVMGILLSSAVIVRVAKSAGNREPNRPRAATRIRLKATAPPAANG
jgi:hypothetical protein